MTSWDALQTALSALRVNALRSLLTMLGIIIGVGAVITMVSVGEGAQAQVSERIQSLGANLIIALSGTASSRGARMGHGSRPTLTEGDALAIGSELDSIQAAAALVSGNAQLIVGNLNWSTRVAGIGPDYIEVREWVIEKGRGLTAQETQAAAKVVLLGATVAENLFPGQDPLGQMVRINKVPCQIVGVLRRKGQSVGGRDQDDTVMVPISTAKKRILGNSRYKADQVSMITIKVRESRLIPIAEQDVAALLRRRHRIQPGQTDDFYLRNLSELTQTREASSRVLTLLLAAVASVSLVVGGIGIMNIMLVSVTERTREIGLRMALGATGRAIRTQFLVEAVCLSMLGGLLGILLGIGGAVAIAEMAGWPVLLQLQTILLAFGFAGAIGVFFGYYPARKAALLNPIEALRHE